MYHGCVALVANFYFGRPSASLIVVGITGTVGKSTTVQMLSRILNHSGKKCGYITTIDFFDGDQNFINKHGLSMPGGWLLQKQLRNILKNGCSHAIVEATSEGLAQNRHWGINFDLAFVTNLSPAHLQAHGGFENYKKAKSKLFSAVVTGKRKKKFTKKVIGVNLDSAAHGYFLQFSADRKFGIAFSGQTFSAVNEAYQAVKTPHGFTLGRLAFTVPLVGEFNIQNALAATACASELGISLSLSQQALATFTSIRGRMEEVKNNNGFRVFVDYGCEPVSFSSALHAALALPHNELIHVFGSTGGHRDLGKRFEFGRISAHLADKIIITNDDVYNSDPEEIANNIQTGITEVEENGELKALQHRIILDRREAIVKALTLAQPGDILLITGKGSEQFLVLPGNKRISWDDVSVVNEELGKLKA